MQTTFFGVRMKILGRNAAYTSNEMTAPEGCQSGSRVGEGSVTFSSPKAIKPVTASMQRQDIPILNQDSL